MVEVAAGPSDSATHEKVSSGPSPPGRNLPGSPAEVGSVSSQLPMVLKVPRLNSSPLALCDRPFSLLGFGDVLVPGASIASVAVWRLKVWSDRGSASLSGLLVVYCHRFDILTQTSRIYFVTCTVGRWAFLSQSCCDAQNEDEGLFGGVAEGNRRAGLCRLRLKN